MTEPTFNVQGIGAWLEAQPVTPEQAAHDALFKRLLWLCVNGRAYAQAAQDWRDLVTPGEPFNWASVATFVDDAEKLLADDGGAGLVM